MAGGTGFSFLYRTDQGRIDRSTWWRGAVPLVVLAAALTAIWTVVMPYTHHDLSQSPLLAVPTLLAFLYLAVFAFALILIAVCGYNLSAKRFHDRGRHGSLAAILPLTAFAAASLIWFIPHSFGEVPDWTASVALAVVAAVLAWNFWDLGLGASR